MGSSVLDLDRVLKLNDKKELADTLSALKARHSELKSVHSEPAKRASIDQTYRGTRMMLELHPDYLALKADMARAMVAEKRAKGLAQDLASTHPQNEPVN